MSWHVEEKLVLSYQEGAVDRVTGASLEAHLTACADCRGLVKADPAWLESSWRGIAERVEPGKPGPLERLLTAVGVPQHHARLAAVSPALRASYLLAVVLVLGFAVLAAGADPAGRTYLIFLFVAPVLPVAGVAFSYGRRVDPAHELTLATPIDALRLLLLRAASVLVVAVGLGLLAWPLVPDPVPGSLGLAAPSARPHLGDLGVGQPDVRWLRPRRWWEAAGCWWSCSPSIGVWTPSTAPPRPCTPPSAWPRRR